MRNLVPAILIAAAFGLGGCYVSKAPFITPATADYPVPHRTHFDGFVPAGKDWTKKEGRTLGIVDGYYVYIEDGETERSVPFLLKRIAPGRFIAQMNDSSDEKRISEYYYELVEFDGTTAIQHKPDCGPRQEWIDKKLIANVERTSTNARCMFAKIEDLAIVLQDAAKTTPPEAKFVVTKPAATPAPAR